MTERMSILNESLKRLREEASKKSQGDEIAKRAKNEEGLQVNSLEHSSKSSNQSLMTSENISSSTPFVLKGDEAVTEESLPITSSEDSKSLNQDDKRTTVDEAAKVESVPPSIFETPRPSSNVVIDHATNSSGKPDENQDEDDKGEKEEERNDVDNEGDEAAKVESAHESSFETPRPSMVIDLAKDSAENPNGNQDEEDDEEDDEGEEEEGPITPTCDITRDEDSTNDGFKMLEEELFLTGSQTLKKKNDADAEARKSSEEKKRLHKVILSFLRTVDHKLLDEKIKEMKRSRQVKNASTLEEFRNHFNKLFERQTRNTSSSFNEDLDYRMMLDSFSHLITNKGEVDHILGVFNQSHKDDESFRDVLIQTLSLLGQSFNVLSRQVINSTSILDLPSWHSLSRTNLRALQNALTTDWMPDGFSFKGNDKSLDDLKDGLYALSFANFSMTIDHTNPSHLFQHCERLGKKNGHKSKVEIASTVATGKKVLDGQSSSSSSSSSSVDQKAPVSREELENRLKQFEDHMLKLKQPELTKGQPKSKALNESTEAIVDFQMDRMPISQTTDDDVTDDDECNQGVTDELQTYPYSENNNEGIVKSLVKFEEDMKDFFHHGLGNEYRNAYYFSCHLLQEVYRSDISLQTPTLCDKFQEVFETIKMEAACHKRDDAIDSAHSSLSIMFEKLKTDLLSEIISNNKKASIEIKYLLTKRLTKEIEQKLKFKKDESTSFVYPESTSSLFSKKDYKINWKEILRK